MGHIINNTVVGSGSNTARLAYLNNGSNLVFRNNFATTGPWDYGTYTNKTEDGNVTEMSDLSVFLATITSNCSHCTFIGYPTAFYGMHYEFTITPDSGYSLPETITISSGTYTLAQGIHYTYSNTTGPIVFDSIPNLGTTLTITATATPA